MITGLKHTLTFALSVLLATVLSLAVPLASAEIYKWTDAQGRVHYGDNPADTVQAEKVTVEINSYEHVSYDAVDSSQAVDSRKVIMYSTSWCGYCKQARRYFQQQGIAFTEFDIEKDRGAKRRYDKLGGRGVPVILVGEKRMNGFSVQGFQRLYR